MKNAKQKLLKVRKSLINHVHYVNKKTGRYKYNGTNNARTQDLLAKYEDLMEHLIENEPNEWVSFCNECEIQLNPNDHDPYDILA